jgi:hypothetical protein
LTRVEAYWAAATGYEVIGRFGRVGGTTSSSIVFSGGATEEDWLPLRPLFEGAVSDVELHGALGRWLYAEANFSRANWPYDSSAVESVREGAGGLEERGTGGGDFDCSGRYADEPPARRVGGGGGGFFFAP